MPVTIPAPSRRAVMGGMAAVATGSMLPAYAASGPAALAPSAMRADIALLRRSYDLLHPGLLRYQSAAQSDARFDALATVAARPLTLPDFYRHLSRCVAGIRCGHSYANFYNQSQAVQSALFATPDRLPLLFRWLGSRLIVTADPLGTGIAPGSEIATIDGRPAAEILAALLAVTRADGGRDGKRRQLLSAQGLDRYETFDIFYPLLFGGRPRYRLGVVDPAGRRRTAAVAAATLAQRRAMAPPPADLRGADPVWQMERRGDAALLTMPNWGLYDSKWDWRAWLDGQMDALVADRVPRLIVDIRANEGGMDCGDALIARLIDAPLPLDGTRRLVRYRQVPDDLHPHLETWDRRFFDWGDRVRPFDDRFFEVTDGAGAAEIRPVGPRYTGQVVVLTGPQNSSATFRFAQLVRSATLATLAGEETGGNRRGFNAIGLFFLRLPETGLEVDLPLIGTFPRSAEPDAGLLPDRPITPTAADIAQRRDPVLSALL